jgi:DNA-binding PadR family transcriptional regulator
METKPRFSISPPLLIWLRENNYTKELPKEVTGIKRYTLTEKGEKFFEKHEVLRKTEKEDRDSGAYVFLKDGSSVQWTTRTSRTRQTIYYSDY